MGLNYFCLLTLARVPIVFWLGTQNLAATIVSIRWLEEGAYWSGERLWAQMPKNLYKGQVGRFTGCRTFLKETSSSTKEPPIGELMGQSRQRIRRSI